MDGEIHRKMQAGFERRRTGEIPGEGRNIRRKKGEQAGTKGENEAAEQDKASLILLFGEFPREKKLKYMKKDTTKTG